jgi:hypothetical protein
MKLWRIRRDMYRAGRLLGDIQAIEKGPTAIAKRVERKWLWRIVGRLLGRWTR